MLEEPSSVVLTRLDGGEAAAAAADMVRGVRAGEGGPGNLAKEDGGS